jgi:purine-binding chemotaxis protein CheW
LRAADAWYGIDTHEVLEVLGRTMPQPVPLAPAFIAGVVPYRGEVLTTVSFRALLGMHRSGEASYVLVFDDEGGERFGLMVDGVGGVMTVAEDSLEVNPGSLDGRSMALFSGSYKTECGLTVRLEPRQLRPSRLAETGLFTAEAGGEMRCG